MLETLTMCELSRIALERSAADWVLAAVSLKSFCQDQTLNGTERVQCSVCASASVICAGHQEFSFLGSLPGLVPTPFAARAATRLVPAPNRLHRESQQQLEQTASSSTAFAKAVLFSVLLPVLLSVTFVACSDIPSCSESRYIFCEIETDSDCRSKGRHGAQSANRRLLICHL